MDKPSSFRRTGSCLRCGKCCNINNFAGTATTIGSVREDGTCVHYIHNGKQGVCLRHVTVRGKPPICEAFPMTPKDIETIPECGYSFEKIHYLPSGLKNEQR